MNRKETLSKSKKPNNYIDQEAKKHVLHPILILLNNIIHEEMISLLMHSCKFYLRKIGKTDQFLKIKTCNLSKLSRTVPLR